MRAANDDLNDELIARTRVLWQPRLGRDLSRDEAKQIAANVIGFFSILAGWSRAERSASADDNAGGAAFDDEEARHEP